MGILIALLATPFILLSCCFAVELFVGIRSQRPVTYSPLASLAPPRAVIVVPAHDEELILADRLGALQRAAGTQTRILVVADNCSDSTAEIARRLHVEVIERTDPTRRGKGFALDAAKRHLERTNPPDVVIIIDADCATDSESISRLALSCAASGRPCQATNLQIPAHGSAPRVKLSTFAFFIRNVVRQRALQRLSGRVHLLGTGMAMPWRLFEAAPLATEEIVEDLKLGLDLSEAGYPPMLVEGATIWSNAETPSDTLSQRTRWEGGFLRNALQYGPAMFGRSVAKGDFGALWTAVNVMIPPFALLLILDIAALAVTSSLALLSGEGGAVVWILAGAIAAALVGLGLAWSTGGSRFVSLGDLVRAPLYIAWKLPVYVGFLRGGAPKEWNRTDRSSL